MKGFRSRLIVIIVMVLSVKCTVDSKRNNKSESSESNIRTKIAPDPLLNNCNESSIDNELTTGLLGINVFQTDTNEIKSLFRSEPTLEKTKKEEQAGEYFIYRFTKGQNQISFFVKPEEGFYLEEGIIEEAGIKLNQDIVIGMRKNTFFEIMSKPITKCDTLTVTNDEYTFKSVFIFRDENLSSIKFNQILE